MFECVISFLRGDVKKVLVLGGGHHKPGLGGLGPDNNFLFLFLLPFYPEASKAFRNTKRVIFVFCPYLGVVKGGCQADFLQVQSLDNFGGTIGKIQLCNSSLIFSFQVILSKIFPPPKKK